MRICQRCGDALRRVGLDEFDHDILPGLARLTCPSPEPIPEPLVTEG